MSSEQQQPGRRRRWLLGASLGAAVVFFAAGILFWGGFNTAMEATNEMEFCISCHEMRDNVYAEYTPTIHHTNRSGVRATCPDCHVPDPWIHKVVRKIQASNEVFHWLLGTVDTPEKFDQRRLHLAKRVWAAMKSTDSRECRNCHNFESMGPENQKPRARKQHLNAFKTGQTCIDCHKGIAHKNVRDQLTDEELERLEAPNPAFARALPAAWAEFDRNGGKLAESPAATPAVEPQPATVVAAAPADALPGGAAVVSPAAAPAADDGLDWSRAPVREITVFYPGQSGMEWILNGRDHGGARPFVKAGDRCVGCHDEETADMGAKIVSGEKLEPKPIAGKRGAIPVQVQAQYDADNLYLKFRWPDAPHAPVEFAEGGRMDPDNAVKLAVVLATDEVEYADRAGCWGGCHMDLRTMPFAPPSAAGHALAAEGRLQLAQGVTKYLTESRTDIEIKGRDDAPLGGWDKLKPAAELDAELQAGHFMDMLRVRSGGGPVEGGYVLDERHLAADASAAGTAVLADGQWTVTLSRPLSVTGAGDLALLPEQVYNFSFAIHDDYSNARYHHVSLGYKLGFGDAEAEVRAVPVESGG